MRAALIVGLAAGLWLVPTAQCEEDTGKIALTKRLKALVIPHVSLADASIEETIEHLRVTRREMDAGVRGATNFVIHPQVISKVTSIDLDLRNVPMDEALRQVAEQADVECRVEENAVVLAPRKWWEEGLHARNYEVTRADAKRLGLDPGRAAEKIAKVTSMDDQTTAACLMRYAAEDGNLTIVAQMRYHDLVESWLQSAGVKMPARLRVERLARSVILPSVNFAEASLEEAVEFARLGAAGGCLDTDRRIKFPDIVIKNERSRASSIKLELRDISAWDALRYIALMSGSHLTVEGDALVLSQPRLERAGN